MLQAQRQRKKSAAQTLVASAPASTALSENGTTATQNGSVNAETHAVPDTDAESDTDMPARQPSVTTASHDSDTEVHCLTTLHFCRTLVM